MSIDVETNFNNLEGDKVGDEVSNVETNGLANGGDSPVATTSSNAFDYNTVFPSLPSTGVSLTTSDAWNTNSRLAIKKHFTTTQVFHVPVEERKYKDVSFGNETNKKCEDIANRLGVKVEICCSKDQSLHIVISGTEEKVLEAKRTIINELQTERDHQLRVPKDQHKYLIGKNGSILKELQEKSCTKIQVPKPEKNQDFITITGPKDGIEQAIHEIQLIIDEQSKTGLERLNIPKLYHPWIRGFNGEIANDISTRTGAKINIPPPLVEKDEIVVSGDREKVEQASNELRKIHAEKSRLNISKLAIQITKSQHKLIIGKNGSTVQDIFKDYDVYVQVPKSDSPSETIYLFGEESKLGAALSQVCAKANSIVNIKIDVPSWLHRHMIGEKGANISKITADYPNTHVKFEPDNKICLDGPPDEVEKVKERLLNISSALNKVMICEEIQIDPKFVPQLTGKKRDNDYVNRLQKDFGVVVKVITPDTILAQQSSNAKSAAQQPAVVSTTNLVRIEGPPESVNKAKVEFGELLKKLENERSKDIVIDQKYHSNLIGKSGKNLNEIRAKFNDIQINIPSVQEKSDIITIRGNKLDVEKCFKHLQQVVKEMQESNYQEDIQIFKEFHRIIIGKQGAFIKKIRDDTQTRIEVPAETSDSNAITIIGRQENVLKARKLLEEKIKELVNIKEDYVEIPHQYHTALIGKGGAVIKQIRNECGGVIINFPTAPTENGQSNGSVSTNLDRIILKGPLDEIKKAKEELLKLFEQKNDLSYSEEVNAKLEYHRYLVGRNGTTVNGLRDKHKVRILFPSSTSNSTPAETSDNNNNNKTDIITIMGKKENVKLARAELEAIIKSLEEQVTEELEVDPKWHKNFTGRGGRLVNKISEDNCKVKISFPKQAASQQNQEGSPVSAPVAVSNMVQIKGPRDAVDAAKKAILDRVYEFDNQVTIQVVIPQKHHVAIIGKKGASSQQISEEFKVEIQFPPKSANEAAVNGDAAHTEQSTENENDSENNSIANSSPSKSDIVTISGLREDCENAKQAILALVPVSEQVPFPSKFHKDLLANKAEVLRDYRNNHNVEIVVPKKGDESDFVTMVGTKENIETAKQSLLEKLNELELNNFSAEITNIKPDFIPQMRGRQGTEAEKIEKKFSVRIEFSKKGDPDRIVIKGLQKNVQDCETFIKKKISDEESKVSQEIEIDNRVHSRLIGLKGKSLAKITEKFKVEIKFSGRESDVVIVKGSSQDAVDDACDHLKNLEEEYLQDVVDSKAYSHPSRQQNSNETATNGQSKGFVVRGAPWEQHAPPLNPNEPAPDTNNMEDFPTITSAVSGGASGSKMPWGPSRK